MYAQWKYIAKGRIKMTTTLNTRIDAKSKEEARKILDCLGLTISEAITLYFRQIILRRGIPFDVEIPNELTAKTLKNSRKGRGLHKAADVDELFRELNR
jgi:DNA-damage-inducible protein J